MTLAEARQQQQADWQQDWDRIRASEDFLFQVLKMPELGQLPADVTQWDHKHRHDFDIYQNGINPLSGVQIVHRVKSAQERQNS